MKYSLPVNIHSNDAILREQDYIYVFHKSDGFSRRLLHANLIVDSQFKYQLQLKSFEYHPATGKRLKLFLAGNLPVNLIQGLKYLLRIKKLGNRIKHGYGQYNSDAEKNLLLIKYENSIIRTAIHVLDVEKFEQKAPVSDKAIVELYQLTEDWIEQIYAIYKEV
jgi:hypothetical protein